MNKKLIIALAAIGLFSTLAMANPPGSGTENGNGCYENCGHGGWEGSTSVPEPATLTLFGGALAAMAFIRRRKQPSSRCLSTGDNEG
jgi:hypothetical protein